MLRMMCVCTRMTMFVSQRKSVCAERREVCVCTHEVRYLVCYALPTDKLTAPNWRDNHCFFVCKVLTTFGSFFVL
ncbi:Hypothetical protein, putative [Bodo saltans]|uniref:Uncharacterized protein n=1 Tax=Bodo saltans TaxID=75058 RepID=A0A0S4IMH4_BODSA|nr:Hypothetical protein, putative [Bodo saltans]|eukprot:CUE72180.1 Hypothetical protein, putative [Bodo saltans]